MSGINRGATLLKLRARQEAIRPESDEDEGAAEHWAEIESVVMTITNSNYPVDGVPSFTEDATIERAAKDVGLESDLVFL